jgi:hypothetical protein
MTRVFLMKWYRWTPEYFEDLRNIHHTEFMMMEKDENGKYELATKLRTWSELHKEEKEGPVATHKTPSSPELPGFRWGGCAHGCNHGQMNFPRRTKRGSVIEKPKSRIQLQLKHQYQEQHRQSIHSPQREQAAVQSPIELEHEHEHDDHPIGVMQTKGMVASPKRAMSLKKLTSSTMLHPFEVRTSRTSVIFPVSSHHKHRHHHHDEAEEDAAIEDEADQDLEASKTEPDADENEDVPGLTLPIRTRAKPRIHPPHLYLHYGRDGGGSDSGFGTPAESPRESDESAHAKNEERIPDTKTDEPGLVIKPVEHHASEPSKPISKIKPELIADSRMLSGKPADALGDLESQDDDDNDDDDAKKSEIELVREDVY